MGESTTLRVSEETADELYHIKGRNRSYDEVVQHLIETHKEAEDLRERVEELEEQVDE